MRRVDRSETHPTRAKQAGAALDPDLLAVDAMTLLAGDPDRLGDFLAATGLTRESLRSAAGEPGFLRGVLDYVGADAALLLDLAKHRGASPEAVGLAIARARRDPEPTA